MPQAEDPNKYQIEKNSVEQEHGNSSNRLFDEVYQQLHPPAKDMNDRLQGVAQGVVQVCNEGFDAITRHPVALARSTVKSIEAMLTTTATIVRKVSAGESNQVVQEIGESLKKAADAYSKMTPKEQGRVIGHDILPMLVPELPLFFRGAKTAEAASEIITTAQEVEETSSQIGSRLNSMGKLTGKLENYLSENNTNYASVKESDQDLVRKSQLKDDTDKHLHNSETEISRSGQWLPSEQFLGKLREACEKLTVDEKSFLTEKGVRIKGVRAAVDIDGNVDEKTRAFYDPNNRIIYIAEQIEYNRRWMPNHNTQFLLKHEIGHAINHLAMTNGELISDSKLFQMAYNKDVRTLSSEHLKDLKLADMATKNIRDEVFAELYALNSDLIPIDSNSHKIKRYFRNCLKYLEAQMK